MSITALFRAEHLPLKKESELKFFYQPYMKKGVVVALFLHVAGVSAYLAYEYIQAQSRVYATRIVKYSDLGPPPALTDAPPMPEVPVAAPSKPVIGIPEPVEDTAVSAEMTIATQTEMSQSIAPVVQQPKEKLIIEAPKEEKIVVEEERLPDFGTFIPYEEPPVVVSLTYPEYPEMARKAGIEGVVMLHVLIDKEGKVRDVRVIKGIGAGLDEAAVKAVKTSIWTPAIQNQRPVAVWVSFPFRFKLR